MTELKSKKNQMRFLEHREVMTGHMTLEFHVSVKNLRKCPRLKVTSFLKKIENTFSRHQVALEN